MYKYNRYTDYEFRVSVVTMAIFKSVKRNRMYENIVTQVQEAILRNDLKCGDKLPSEKELGSIFGVSRTTVREAIRSLQQMGVVEVRQGNLGGAYIKEIDIDTAIEQMGNILTMTNVTLQQLAEARAILEGSLIARLKSSQIDNENFDQLDRNVAMAEAYYMNNNNEERLRTNFMFHTIIVGLSGNSILTMMHKLIASLSMNFYTNVESSREMYVTSMNYHKSILQLLKDGNFVKASEVCVKHIYDTTASIIEKSKHQSILRRSQS